MKATKILKKVVFLFSFLLLIVISGCDDDTLDSDKKTGDSINTAKLLQLVNEQRSKGCNCGTEYYAPTTQLTWNNTLTLTAYDHSFDMNKKNFFSHTGSDGSNVGDRATRRGYIWKALGENIAKGHTSEDAVINDWIKSEGHCKNIMNPNYKDMGVSKVGSYWTQVFGALK